MATTPSFAAQGSTFAGTSSLSVTWPAHTAGQMGLLVIVSDAVGVAATVSISGGWTAISDGNQVVGTGATGCRMQLFRRIASSSSEPAITVPISTNANVYSRIFTFNNVSQTSSPVPVSAGSVQPAASTTVTYPAVSTLTDDCLVVCLSANGTTSATVTGSMTNASLTSIAKHNTTNAASSSVLLSGTKATAGSVVAGTSLWTISTSHVAFTLVLAPVPDVVAVDTDTTELDLRPEQAGYSCNVQNSCIEVPALGGPLKKRQDVAWAPHIVTATWFLDSTEYSAFMGFFRTELDGGADQFLIDLVTDIGIPTRHKCRTISGLPKLTKQSGEAYWVSCTLEAEQNPTYTGLIKYQEPGNILFTVTNPKLTEGFEAGDLVQIIDSKGVHPSGSTPLNLDGIYTITSTTGSNQITLTSPTVVNAGWTTLAGLGSPGEYGDASNGNVISTITRVPT